MRNGYACCASTVSIHAPRAGRDLKASVSFTRFNRFNPRAPRGARLKHLELEDAQQGFNPRAPRGARPPFKSIDTKREVSIHAPRAGRDNAMKSALGIDNPFQSTRPARGATSRIPTPTDQPEPQRPKPDSSTDPNTVTPFIRTLIGAFVQVPTFRCQLVLCPLLFEMN